MAAPYVEWELHGPAPASRSTTYIAATRQTRWYCENVSLGLSAGENALVQVSYFQFFRATIEEEIALAARQSGLPPPTEDVVSRFRLPALDTNPRDLTYPQMWRLQFLLLGSVFNPSVLFIDEIVAPGAPGQRAALEYTLAHRHSQGRVTMLAYQRALETRFDRLFTVDGGMVSATGTTAG